jgi:hypothetical protein
MKNEEPQQPVPGGTPVERPVVRQVPERAGFLVQIEHCKREVACWPAWMKQTAAAPNWMAGWDD